MILLKSGVTCAEIRSDDPRMTYVSISGSVKELGKNIRARVYLFNRNNLNTPRVASSSQNGDYCFKGVCLNAEYLILSKHPIKKFNAVIQDNVVPK